MKTQTIFTGKDFEEVAIKNCEPLAWRNAALKYLSEGNLIKWAYCLRMMDLARINLEYDE